MAAGDKAKTPKTKKSKFAWIGQIRDNYKLTKQTYPKIGWQLAGMFLGLLALGIGIGFLVGSPVMLGLIGWSLGLLAMSIWFSRRAMSAAYKNIEDQPGGAAAVAQSMRGNWNTTPAVSITRNEDMVHRVIGRPGVVLISEGPPTRVQHMLNSEKKRTQRFIPDTPITLIQVGTAEDQVPVAKLQKALNKLPKTLTPAEVTEVRRKLDALAKQPPASVPKGPVPRSAKAARAQQRGH